MSYEIREYRRNDSRGIGNEYVVLVSDLSSREDAERALSQMIISDLDLVEIAEVISLKIDKEAAGYLVDLLGAHVAGTASLDFEPLGRVRMALDALRFSGPDGERFSRNYLLDTRDAGNPSQRHPVLSRPDAPENLVNEALSNFL